MEMFSGLGPETIYQEYKESVLSHYSLDRLMFMEFLQTKKLTTEYQDLIEQQIKYDLEKYLPKYLSSFYNGKKNRTYRWYYGVADQGIITGIPIAKEKWAYVQDMIISSIENLINNQIVAVVHFDKIGEHVKTCNDYHREVYYYHLKEKKCGYLCPSQLIRLKSNLRIEMIPLRKPTIESVDKRDDLNFITEINQLIDKNNHKLAIYRKAMDVFNVNFNQWVDKMNYYSSKIETIMSNPSSYREFQDFVKMNGLITEEDYCHSSEKSYQVGQHFIKELPFMDAFREFRDYKRSVIRIDKPRRPRPPKDYTLAYANRLAFTNYFLLNQPDILYFIIKVTLDKVQFDDRHDYSIVYYNNTQLIYQRRSLNTSGQPQCSI